MKRELTLLFLISAIAIGMATPPKGYYSGLEGKNQGALKNAAKNAVRKHTVVEYGSDTWDAFEKTDVRIVNGVTCWWDMYSNKNVSVSSGHDGMNIEHSVANSWWGKTKNDAYKDLFHLNPSDAEANNRKSNYPMGIVVDATYDNGVTKVGHPASGDCGGARNVYEPPMEYKGDFARAFMYIFTVYDDIAWSVSQEDRNFMFDGSAYPSFRPWAYEMLLQWSREDPVSQKEIERNEAIYQIQNNRNPFIDYPELAEYIWGDKKNEAFHADGEAGTPGGDPDPGDNPDPGNDPDQPTLDPQGKGTEAMPYNVDYVLTETVEKTNVWVQGFVVGYVEGYKYEEGVVFSNIVPEGSEYINTNLLLAADKDCKDTRLCIPVQLPASNNFRNELGLGNNPDIYKKEIKIRGDLKSYFGVPGHKNLSEYKIVESGIEIVAENSGVWEGCNVDGGIKIITDRQRSNVTVTSIAGMSVWSAEKVDGGEIIALPAGIYILKADKAHPRKLIVR